MLKYSCCSSKIMKRLSVENKIKLIILWSNSVCSCTCSFRVFCFLLYFSSSHCKQVCICINCNRRPLVKWLAGWVFIRVEVYQILLTILHMHGNGTKAIFILFSTESHFMIFEQQQLYFKTVKQRVLDECKTKKSWLPRGFNTLQ